MYPVSDTRCRRGLTLVEMLVATAVTLALVLAVTQSFAVVSQIISANRASLEMAGQLRGTTVRLQNDLDAISAPVTPWLDSTAGLGYFEYIEGYGTDSFPRMHQLGVVPIDTLPANSLPRYSHLGDVDDILMFTAKSSEEPFTGVLWGPDANGIRRPLTYTADAAEVVWWTVLQDTNRNELWDPGETFKLHRRVLLIKPELNNPDTGMLDQSAPYEKSPMGLNLFYNENDISVRPVLNPNSGTTIGFTANSLGDLTLRQNRFAHYPVSRPPATPFFVNTNRQTVVTGYFPYEIALESHVPTSLINLVQWGANRGPDNGWGNAGQDDDFDGVVDNASEALWAGTDDLGGIQIGHDVILPNVLSFDVRAFDVTAPLFAYLGDDGGPGVDGVDDNNVGGADDLAEIGWPRSDDEALAPGDPGWNYNPAAIPVQGTGAYVDLYYLNTRPDLIGAFNSQFSHHHYFQDFNGTGIHDSGEPGLRRPTYDTWPLDYERNGLSENLPPNMKDEGTNHIDDAPFVGGVDDLTERETHPPYSSKLRGIQIRIRIVDPDTQQVRQQTVRAKF